MMKAYIRVIYSSEGRPPAEVTKIMKEMGFHKMKGQPLFEGEVADEGELDQKMGSLHSALRGMEVRYIPTFGAPADAEGALQYTASELMKGWKESGLDVERLSMLLDTDPVNFMYEAVAQFKDKVEAVAATRERELREEEEKRLKEQQERDLREAEERKVARISTLFGREGGVTFHQLHEDTGLATEELGDLIKDMVDNGRLRAVQRGRNVVYVTA